MRQTESGKAGSSLWDWFKGVVYCCATVLGPVGGPLFILLALVSLFYLEENWRGKRAWAQVQAETVARGKEVDWAKFIPPPVPDDQNFFKAPHMQLWFTGRGGRSLSKKLAFENFRKFTEQSASAVARVTFVAPGADVAPEDADLVLSFHDPELTVSQGPEDVSKIDPHRVIQRIEMDTVPLSDAIKNLAQQANIRYRLDTNISYWQTRPDGRLVQQPDVSFKWTNTTAIYALRRLLANYNLALVPESAGVARIVAKDNAKPSVLVSADLHARLGRLIEAALPPQTNRDDGRHLTAASDFDLAAQSLGVVKPARIIVRSEEVPDKVEVRNFFPQYPVGGSLLIKAETQVRATGSNTFEVYLSPPPSVSAADYLAWSDQFEADFNAIREAAKRPYARMDGDYTMPAQIPVPNFVCVRIVAQTLAQRTQCHLLLGEPDKALHDLILVRDLCRLLEGRPTQKPMTLVAVMINSAVTGLYVKTFGDGLRMHAWREPELAAIEAQLAEVNLPPMLDKSLDFERVAGTRGIELMTAENYRQMMGLNEKDSQWDKLKDPVYQLLMFAPRGWVYQNMAVVGRIHQAGFDGMVLPDGSLSPLQFTNAMQETDRQFKHNSPFITLAAMVVANFTHAAKNLGWNQTLANEARVVCALERYKLARGEYPETLDALVPQFIEKLPRDLIGGAPLKYRRADGHFTLYSIGWNEVDDGGVVSPGIGAESVDWIWPY